jgi:hypothetical protein
MLKWLSAFGATVKVLGELWKGYKMYTDAVEQDGSGEAKRNAVFGLMGYSFEMCEKYTVDTPLSGTDIQEMAKRVWALWEQFCIWTGKFKKPTVPVEPTPEPEPVEEAPPVEETPSEEVA